MKEGGKGFSKGRKEGGKEGGKEGRVMKEGRKGFSKGRKVGRKEGGSLLAPFWSPGGFGASFGAQNNYKTDLEDPKVTESH